MHRFRTIRQRRQRASKAQVAAVATVLGLLLVVTFIANFVIDQLPGELGSVEFNHILQVENQISRLQATILAQARESNLHLALSSPVTLGSASVPPFGPPAAGSVSTETVGVKTNTSYSIGQIDSTPPVWNTGSACLNGGTGTCNSNGNVFYWNVSGKNHTAVSATIGGTTDSLRYNLTGNNDTIAVKWTGGNVGFIDVIINGSFDTVTYTRSETDVTIPTAVFQFYGQHDTFVYNPTGTHAAAGGTFVNVGFVGSQNTLCPTDNLSNTDKVGTLSTGGTNLLLSVTWWNAEGYASGPKTQTYPGGGGATNETIHWQNQTGIVGCAFTTNFASTYHVQYSSGILARLFNRYDPVTDIAFDQGAVIQSELGGHPLMIIQPPFYYHSYTGGFSANLTLINSIGTPTSETGIDTAVVTSQVLSVHTLVIQNGIGGNYLLSPYYLNITTSYPNAWLRYFAAEPVAFPSGAACVSSVVFSAPYSCSNPPTGATVTVIAPLFATTLIITTVTVQLTIV